jgi:ribosomal protein S18 acetylase RimI-like enzyme
MPLRPIQLPKDIQVMVDLIINGFQYPENETWSLQFDQKENMVSVMKSAQRLWPFLWIARLFSPHWRDYTCGFIWEEGTQPVGVLIYFREGMLWNIAYIVILPEFRRRGIARQLLQATLSNIQERGGKTVVLDVLAGNTPAYTLFGQVGFTKYTSYLEFIYEADETHAQCSIPEGYILSPLKLSDWRTYYELEKRITPDEVQRFEPVEPSRFRSQVAIRRVVSLVDRASGNKRERYTIQLASNKQAVAYGMFAARTREGGINSIWLELDEEHGILAPFLLNFLIHSVQQIGPGRRIEFTLPEWQNELVNTTLALENIQTVQYHQLGLWL